MLLAQWINNFLLSYFCHIYCRAKVFLFMVHGKEAMMYPNPLQWSLFSGLSREFLLLLLLNSALCFNLLSSLKRFWTWWKDRVRGTVIVLHCSIKVRWQTPDPALSALWSNLVTRRWFGECVYERTCGGVTTPAPENIVAVRKFGKSSQSSRHWMTFEVLSQCLSRVESWNDFISRWNDCLGMTPVCRSD